MTAFPAGPSLVIQTAFLGDVVLTTPLLSTLAERGPVDVVTTPAGAPLLTGHPAVREVFAWDKRGAGRGPGGLLRMALRLRRREEPYAGAYLAQASVRSAALARAAGIPRRVGFEGAAGRALYTARVSSPPGLHHAERLWRLAFPDGPADGVAPAPSLHPGPAEREAVDALLRGAEAAGARPDQPLVALAPGSAWATKRWPGFEELAAALGGDARLVVVGGADEAALALRIAEAHPGAVAAAGKLSLLASAEMIRRARVLVTNDSSPTHLASAVGTPTLTIYGPTSPSFGFGPLAAGSAPVLQEPMPCRPCHHHGPPTCPLGHWRCMRDLEAGTVLAAVREVLQRGGSPPR